MPEGKWICLEPYYGGSHRHLVDGLVERLPFELEIWTLPPRKWKWRMRGAAPFFAERWRRERPRARGIFTSSLLDAAALRGLLPSGARNLPLVVYFHENQLCYPVRVADKRDYHYGWTNIQSALAADRVCWNSAFNRDSFLAELPAFLKRLPDADLTGAVESIAGCSQVLPVPLDVRSLAAVAEQASPREGPCRLVWNHRWEHDKDPGSLFEALDGLLSEDLEFGISILGQQFSDQPPIFSAARQKLASRIVHWGYIPDRSNYFKALCRADFALSTARHEFQGLALLEAAACGAAPLVPDSLVYPEIWPPECRYEPSTLADALKLRIRELEQWRRRDFREYCRHFDWEQLLPRWLALFREFY